MAHKTSQTSSGLDMLSTKPPKNHLAPSALRADFIGKDGMAELTIQENSVNIIWQRAKMTIILYLIRQSMKSGGAVGDFCHSSSGTRLSMSIMCSSMALVTRRVAFTPMPPFPLGNNFFTSSFCRFSRLLTPNGIPRNPVICSFV